MTAEHARLSALLEDQATKLGGRKAVAGLLGIAPTEVSDLINGRRFVTMRQALRIENVLGVSARDLLIESAIAKIDEDLAKVRAQP